MHELQLTSLYAAGLLTFASPCVLPLIPLYLASLAGTVPSGLQQNSRAALFAAALGFSAGLSAVFVALGLAATALGATLLAHRQGLLQVAGFVVLLFGLRSLGVVRIPALEGEARPLLSKLGGRGPLGGVLLGAGFALGWSPCIGPVLGTVLTWTAANASRPAEGALYLGIYAAGLTTPLLALALLASRLLPWLNALKQRLPLIERATGTLLVAAGLLLVTDSVSLLTPSAEDTSPQQAITAACTGEGACALPAVDEQTPSPVTPGQLPKGPVVVEFLSRACPVCERMAPIVKLAERACEHEGVVTAQVYVDTPSGQKLAVANGVRGVPTFLALDSSGAEVARLVGEQALTALVAASELSLGANCARPDGNERPQAGPG